MQPALRETAGLSFSWRNKRSDLRVGIQRRGELVDGCRCEEIPRQMREVEKEKKVWLLLSQSERQDRQRPLMSRWRKVLWPGGNSVRVVKASDNFVNEGDKKS